MSLPGRAADGFFASETVVGHLLRGAMAFALFGWAITHQEAHPLLAFAAGAGALLALRGCPMCWTIGLVQVLRNARRRRRIA